MTVLKTTVKSGCGVVLEGVDSYCWVTISRIPVPLRVGTAMAAKVMGVCLNVQNINRCMDTILKKSVLC